MKPLPHWVLTDKRPSIYESETGSVLEMTAKVYAAMQELITEYNSFVDEVNAHISEYESGFNGSIEKFEKCITETVEKYIKSIDLKIDKQDLKINQAIQYMKEEINKTTTDILNSAISAGQITIVQEYDPETESLNMVVSGGV